MFNVEKAMACLTATSEKSIEHSTEVQVSLVIIYRKVLFTLLYGVLDAVSGQPLDTLPYLSLVYLTLPTYFTLLSYCTYLI